MTSTQQTLYRNLKYLGLVPRRGKAGKFIAVRSTRQEIAAVVRRLRNEQRQSA